MVLSDVLSDFEWWKKWYSIIDATTSTFPPPYSSATPCLTTAINVFFTIIFSSFSFFRMSVRTLSVRDWPGLYLYVGLVLEFQAYAMYYFLVAAGPLFLSAKVTKIFSLVTSFFLKDDPKKSTSYAFLSFLSHNNKNFSIIFDAYFLCKIILFYIHQDI